MIIMKAPIIDTMLKKLETAADAQGILIDENEDYKAMCQIVTDYVYDGTIPTVEQKQYIAETLRAMYNTLGLNYEQTLNYLIEKEWNK